MPILLKAKEGLVPVKKKVSTGAIITFYVRPDTAKKWQAEGKVVSMGKPGAKPKSKLADAGFKEGGPASKLVAKIKETETFHNPYGGKDLTKEEWQQLQREESQTKYNPTMGKDYQREGAKTPLRDRLIKEQKIREQQATDKKQEGPVDTKIDEPTDVSPSSTNPLPLGSVVKINHEKDYGGIAKVMEQLGDNQVRIKVVNRGFTVDQTLGEERIVDVSEVTTRMESSPERQKLEDEVFEMMPNGQKGVDPDTGERYIYSVVGGGGSTAANTPLWSVETKTLKNRKKTLQKKGEYFGEKASKLSSTSSGISAKAQRMEANIRSVLTDGYKRVGGRMVDPTTANMLVTILDNLPPAKKEKFLSLPITKMVQIGWSVVKKSEGPKTVTEALFKRG